METVRVQEIESRVRNFQLRLQEMELDGAFILQNADLFYFSGTIQSPEELMRAHDVSVEIHDLFVKEAKPGVLCSDLYRLALKKAEKTGFGEYFNGYKEGKVRFVGHGLGLEIDEYPIFSPRFNQTLEPGMVIALEPMFVFPGKGIVGLEDDYLVTTKGVERLTVTDQTLMKI